MAYYSEFIVIGISIILGIIGIQGTLHLQMFQGTQPGAGFWPVLMGVILIILASVEFLKNRGTRKGLDKTIDKDGLRRVTLFYIFYVVMTIFGSYIIGMLPSLIIFLSISLIAWYRLSYGRALIISLGIVAVVYIIFDYLLSVPFPGGLFS